MRLNMKRQIKKIYKKGVSLQLEAIGVVELILILVVIIGLVLIFRSQITQIVNEIFNAITTDTSDIIGEGI
jgi:hypothetical protein